MLALIRRFFGWAQARRLSVGLIVLLSTFVLFVWHLGSLTTGLSSAEAVARDSSRSWQAIWDDPTNAPHKVLQHLAQAAGYHGATGMRLVSVFFALIFVACFYKIAKGWFGRLVGGLGTLLLASTPLFIMLARNASPSIMLLSPLVVAAGLMWLARTKKNHDLVLLLLAVAIAFCAYAPGGLWAVLLGILIGRKILVSAIKGADPPVVSLLILVPLLLLAPLILAAARHWSIAAGLLLIPDHWPNILECLRSSGWALLSIFWHSRSPNEFIIGRLAVLSAIQIALGVFGLYAMFNQARLEAVALVGLLLLGLVASGINQSYTLILLVLPVVSLFVVAGLRYLYVEWRTIFPRNPLPRSLAIVLMMTLVGFQIVYGIRYSLVAWPRTEAAKHLYVLK